MGGDDATTKPVRRTVAADLVETTPDAGGALHWLLAAPVLVFLAWVWVDVFAYYSPVRVRWLDALLALVVYMALIVGPLGLAAHRLVTGAPWLFQRAGWDVVPLELISAEEQYVVRYACRQRLRAEGTWRRRLMRAGQGWVYIEIATILAGAMLLIPLFLSATEFGFGR